MTDAYHYRPARFFLAAYCATWIPWFLAAYAGSHRGVEPYAVPLNFVGLAAPCLVARILIFASGNAALKGDFKDRLLNPRRIRPAYLFLAIVTPFAIIAASIGLSLLLGQSPDQFRLSAGPNLIALIILALVIAPLLEEMGWRGYGVDSLRAEAPILKATLLFAVLWCLWHAPLMLIEGTYQHQLATMDNPIFVANFFVSIVPAAIITNWFFYNNRSIPAAVALHSMLNAASVLMNAGQFAKCIATLLCALATGLIMLDRGLFAEGPRSFLGGRDGTA